MANWHVPIAVARLAQPEPGRLSALMMQHGSMSLRYYAPKQIDPQTPHDQDEIYIVAAGSALVLAGSQEGDLERRACTAGDVIFVPAGRVHRFVEMSADFGTWVVFWGPKGGEQD